MVVMSGASSSEDAHERGREVNSSLASTMQDDNTETVKPSLVMFKFVLGDCFSGSFSGPFGDSFLFPFGRPSSLF